ncbi:MAG TPA: glutathione binding-like protein [Gammaproteobacteria bacterium]|nr:glutathione binding-like protein [Gammaproteobacteria bacterium]
MYELYLAPSTAGFAPHALLREIGADFSLRFLDVEAAEHKRPEYLRLNPLGKIPVLLVDGRPVAETGAILMLLAERHPDAALAPAVNTAARQDYLQWMLFLANTLHAGLIPYFYPARYTADPEGADGVKRGAERLAGQWFAHVEEAFSDGRPYLLGETLSAADFYLFMLARWGRHFEAKPSSQPRLGEFMQRMFTRPSIRDAFAAEGTTENFF